MHAVASGRQTKRDHAQPACAHEAAHLGLGAVQASRDLGVGQQYGNRQGHVTASA